MSASPAAASTTDSSTKSSVTNLRVLAPRRSLPGSRAIVGGVLVAVAVLGSYAATTQAGKQDTRTVVVAAHDIAPGTRIQPSDLRVVKLPIDATVANHVLQSTSKLSGSTALAPLRSGDMIQTSAIASAQSQTPYLEVSFSVEAARALDGNLQPGETVDVLTTDKTNAAAGARVAASDARVLRVQAGSSNIGKSGDVTITVGVNSRTEAAAIAAAVDQGQVTLVRTTGAKPNE